jgi:hypothetical protein
MRVDVHQHVWPGAFVEALRARRTTPRLDGWTLILDGEPDYEVPPEDHDVERRAAQNRADGLDLALVSLSSPLGIELLPPAEAAPLLDAYHAGALALPDGFGTWAAAGVAEPDSAALAGWLDKGCVGLQLPAVGLADRAAFERCEPLLRVLTGRGKPLFVHPGPAASHDAPAWWAANVDYVRQMHAAYFGYLAFARAAHPTLKVCFAMLGGLAPLHWERVRERGGPEAHEGPGPWFETSSYGAAAVGQLATTVGQDRLVLGSDRPYAVPTPLADEAAAGRAVHALLAAPL